MKPTRDCVIEMITKLEEKLFIKELNKTKNVGIKEGYQESIRILTSHLQIPINDGVQSKHIRDWSKFNAIYRKQLEPIKMLKTIQGRSIAIISIDWLNGDTDIASVLEINIK